MCTMLIKVYGRHLCALIFFEGMWIFLDRITGTQSVILHQLVAFAQHNTVILSLLNLCPGSQQASAQHEWQCHGKRFHSKPFLSALHICLGLCGFYF
jgi:hypothetical protein